MHALDDLVGRDELDVGQPDGLQPLPELAERQRAGDAADVRAALRALLGVRRSSATTSLTPIRPPGLRTRAISRNTAGLSEARLMTQLLMTTSTLASSSGRASIVPLRNSTFVGAGVGGVAPGEGEHLVGHVDADRATGRADATRGEQDVDAAARAEVEDGLALAQLGDRDGIAAAERREERGVGDAFARRRVVQLEAVRAGDVGAAAVAAAAARVRRVEPSSRRWRSPRSRRTGPQQPDSATDFDAASCFVAAPEAAMAASA